MTYITKPSIDLIGQSHKNDIMTESFLMSTLLSRSQFVVVTRISTLSDRPSVVDVLYRQIFAGKDGECLSVKKYLFRHTLSYEKKVSLSAAPSSQNNRLIRDSIGGYVAVNRADDTARESLQNDSRIRCVSTCFLSFFP